MTNKEHEAIQRVKEAQSYLEEAVSALSENPEEAKNPEFSKVLNELDEKVKTLLSESKK